VLFCFRQEIHKSDQVIQWAISPHLVTLIGIQDVLKVHLLRQVADRAAIFSRFHEFEPDWTRE
jgi:hypothetical protein